MDALHYVLLGWNIVVGVAVVRLWIEIKAMVSSTHSVQYIDPFKDMKQEFEPVTDDIKERLTKKDFDNVM